MTVDGPNGKQNDTQSVAWWDLCSDHLSLQQFSINAYLYTWAIVETIVNPFDRWSIHGKVHPYNPPMFV